jgi:hypothetical protein
MIYEAAPRNMDVVEYIERKRDDMVGHLERAFEDSDQPRVEAGQLEIIALIDSFWESCAKRAAGRA